MNRFLMILIFALVAALAQASFVTQGLEERLVMIESRLEKLEKCQTNQVTPFIFAPGSNYQTLENKNIQFAK